MKSWSILGGIWKGLKKTPRIKQSSKVWKSRWINSKRKLSTRDKTWCTLPSVTSSLNTRQENSIMKSCKVNIPKLSTWVTLQGAASRTKLLDSHLYRKHSATLSNREISSCSKTWHFKVKERKGQSLPSLVVYLDLRSNLGSPAKLWPLRTLNSIHLVHKIWRPCNTKAVKITKSWRGCPSYSKSRPS